VNEAAGEGHLVQQGADLARVIDIVRRQRSRDDLTGVGVDANMRLPPGSACLRAVFPDLPFTGGAELQPDRITQPRTALEAAKLLAPFHGNRQILACTSTSPDLLSAAVAAETSREAGQAGSSP
jgi:hypothetical protein